MILGNGFFKPTISSFVSLLYERDDVRREGGYTLFYIGINVGSAMASLLSGVVVHSLGFHGGFLASAIGMLIALGVFNYACRTVLKKQGLMPTTSLFQGRNRQFLFWCFCAVLILLAYLLYLAFQHTDLMRWILNIVAILIVGSVAFLAFRQKPEWRYKMWAALLLIIVSMGFWAMWSQTFSSLMLFSARNLSDHFLGVPMSPQMIPFFEPFFLVILGVGMSFFWSYLGVKNINPSYPMKFAMSLFMVFLGYLVLTLAS